MNLFSDYVAEFPLISDLIRGGREVVAKKASLAAVEEQLQLFLRSDEPGLIVNKCIAELEAYPHADPPFMTDGHIMLCNDFGGLTVAIGCATAATSETPLYSSTSEALLGCCSPEGLTYRLHTLPADWNPEVFSSEVTIDAPQTGHCAKGGTVLLPVDRIFDYTSSGSLVVKVMAPVSVALMWEFDRTSLKALRVHASTLQATTVSFIMRFLSKYGNENSNRAIGNLVDHPFHYVRWEVVKTLGQRDIGALTEVLGKLKDDPHPHVRTASQKTLAQLGGM